jgi:hypothetical protein
VHIPAYEYSISVGYIVVSLWRSCKARHNPGCHDQAETMVLGAFEGCTSELSLEHPHTLDSLNLLKNLIELYKAWGKPEKAEEWRAKLPQTEAVEQ